MFDVFFISYNEPNAEENLKVLRSKVPFAKRVKDVEGIHKAHKAAAMKSFTNMFWAVDGDATVLDSFKFDIEIPEWDQDAVHIWQSINPVNGLVYGYGGIKLLPRDLTLTVSETVTDMTTNICSKIKVINEVSNISAFNTDPFSTWRSAFRECVKLASGSITNSDPDESLYRLEVWTTDGADKPYGNYCIDGSIKGRDYGFEYSNDPESLKLINDFKWLKEKFLNECKIKS